MILQHIQQATHVSLEEDDVESLFSEHDEPDGDTVFALGPMIILNHLPQKSLAQTLKPIILHT